MMIRDHRPHINKLLNKQAKILVMTCVSSRHVLQSISIIFRASDEGFG